MPNHFSAIGFRGETGADLQRMVRQAAEQGEMLAATSGSYVRWAVGDGPQLWLQVNPHGDVLGLDPHFAGRARMRVALRGRITPPGDNSLDGAFRGLASPSDDDPESGAYPFVFDAPDFDLHHALSLPAIVDVQLAAFAHELSAYPSQEAYLASQQVEPRFAPESFIPSGLFTPSSHTGKPTTARARAIFSGRILRSALQFNVLTGASFHWAWVRTYGGEVDIVAEPEVLNGALVEGGIVRGSFWLSGLVQDSQITGDGGG